MKMFIFCSWLVWATSLFMKGNLEFDCKQWDYIVKTFFLFPSICMKNSLLYCWIVILKLLIKLDFITWWRIIILQESFSNSSLITRCGCCLILKGAECSIWCIQCSNIVGVCFLPSLFLRGWSNRIKVCYLVSGVYMLSFVLY